MVRKAWNQISKFLFGDDIFISYARADGGIYATGLANELVKENFSCKFDLWGTESGKEMPDSLTSSLKRCSIMVLIGTEAAAENRNVGIEVEMFEKTGRPIIPIIFEGVELSEGRYCQTGKLQTPQKNSEATANPSKPLTKAIWADAIAGQSISCERDEALESGDPTPAIVARVEKSSTFTRKDQRLKRASFVATAILVLFSSLSIVAGFLTYFARNEAERQTEFANEQQKRGERLRYASNMWQASNAYNNRSKGFDNTFFENLLEDTSQLIGTSAQNLQNFEWFYLNRVTKGLTRLIKMPKNTNSFVEYSPSGKLLVSITDDKSALAIFDSYTGELKKEISTPDRLTSVTEGDIVFSSDEKWLVITNNQEFRIWNTTEWKDITDEIENIDKVKKILSAYTIKTVSFGKENKEILFHSENNEFLRWEFQNKTDEPTIFFNTKDLQVLDFTSDGCFLVKSETKDDEDQEIKFQVSLLNSKSEKKPLFSAESEKMSSYNFNNNDSCFSSNFNIVEIRTGLNNDELYVWTKDNLPEATEIPEVIEPVALSPDGKMLAFVKEQGIVTVWDIEKEEDARSPIPINTDNLIGKFASDNSKLLLASSLNNYISVWSIQSEDFIFNFENEKPLAVSPDGNKAVTLKDPQEKQMTLWDTHTKTSSEPISFKGDVPEKVQFSPNGKYFNTSDQVWKSINKDVIKIETKIRPECNSQIAYSSDSTKFAQICKKNDTADLRIVNLESLEEKTIPVKSKVGNANLEIVFVMNDEKITISTTPMGQLIEILDIKENKTLFNQKINESSESINEALVFSKKEQKIYSTSKLKKDFLPEGNEFELVELEGLSPKTNNLQLSPLENWAIATKRRAIQQKPGQYVDYILAYWNLKTGKVNHIKFGGEENCTFNPTFSADETRLISTCTDGNIILWDLEIGQRVSIIETYKVDCEDQDVIDYGCLSQLSTRILPGNKNLLTTILNQRIQLWATEFSSV